MIEQKDFEHLERTVKTIATHFDYPGKQLLVHAYLDAIEGRWREGRLTFVQCPRSTVRLRSSVTDGLLPALIRITRPGESQ